MPPPWARAPSLDLLKGFVAVARRMSITQAADDLGLTQSGMSKQVRTLEEALGVRLLHRGYRQITLTEEGQRLFRAADGAIGQLQDALATATTRLRRPVTVTASTGVAALWLLPRLADFQKSHADVDLRVMATNTTIADLAAEQIDLAIRYCSPDQAPHGAVRLFGETLAPVASPLLDIRALDSSNTLSRQVLLEFDDARRHWLRWENWLAAAGWSPDQCQGILRFNQYDQAILAAVAGQGIAIGRLELLAPMLADGRLRVLETPHAGPASHYACWLVQASAHPRREVRHVIDWIMATRQAAPPPTSGSALQ